ncbi:MAG: T9SS type A sorting domain-containing protein [Candidatus Symbiothrix sp.]|nr:T9SS type A sorting domain-containing protein [Candidatus Symbiothrix sp.]
MSSQIEKTCKLYVPKGSLSAYRSAYYWRNFVNIIEEDDATAIDNVSTQNLSVYPNPAKHDLFIRSDSPIEKIDLYNQLGQLVLKATDFVEKIDVSHLEAGIYFVRIIVDGTVVTKKIVVK